MATDLEHHAATLVVDDVSHQYPVGKTRIWALRDVSVTVPGHQFLSVLGPSGCGKSTLLRLVTGLMKPSAGTLTLGGRRITGPGLDRGVVFQDAALLPWLKVRENVRFALRRSGLPKEETIRIAEDVLEIVGLGDRGGLYPYQLSGGMRSRVAVARAWALPGASVLLMDEPFAAIDAMTRQALQDHLVTMWQSRPRTVVYITHDIEEAVYLADRVIVMQGPPGQVAADFAIHLDRPRDRASAAFARERAKVTEVLEQQRK
jgi:NitT/TauT family transport system ATP-binding protein